MSTVSERSRSPPPVDAVLRRGGRLERGELRTDEIIAALIKEVVIPPALAGAWLVGRVGNSELGKTTFLANTTSYSALDAGSPPRPRRRRQLGAARRAAAAEEHPMSTVPSKT